MNVFKRLAVVFTICLLVGLSTFTVATSFINKQVAVCESTNKSNATLSALLSFFEGRTLSSSHLSTKKKDAVTAFYADALKQIPKQQNC